MATKKTKTLSSKKATKPELDSIYFLKILLYVILGSTWIVWHDHKTIPIGLVVGLGLVQYEHLRIDRKIEYAALLIAALIGLAGPGISFVA